MREAGGRGSRLEKHTHQHRKGGDYKTTVYIAMALDRLRLDGRDAGGEAPMAS